MKKKIDLNNEKMKQRNCRSKKRTCQSEREEFVLVHISSSIEYIISSSLFAGERESLRVVRRYCSPEREREFELFD